MILIVKGLDYFCGLNQLYDNCRNWPICHCEEARRSKLILKEWIALLRAQ
jgi:hypothetical protein